MRPCARGRTLCLLHQFVSTSGTSGIGRFDRMLDISIASMFAIYATVVSASKASNHATFSPEHSALDFGIRTPSATLPPASPCRCHDALSLHHTFGRHPCDLACGRPSGSLLSIEPVPKVALSRLAMRTGSRGLRRLWLPPRGGSRRAVYEMSRSRTCPPRNTAAATYWYPCGIARAYEYGMLAHRCFALRVQPQHHDEHGSRFARPPAPHVAGPGWCTSDAFA